MERIFDSSVERVDFEQIAKALCTSVDIKFIFGFLGLKEFQRTYWPVKVGFLYIEVIKWQSFFSTTNQIPQHRNFFISDWTTSPT